MAPPHGAQRATHSQHPPPSTGNQPLRPNRARLQKAPPSQQNRHPSISLPKPRKSRVRFELPTLQLPSIPTGKAPDDLTRKYPNHGSRPVNSRDVPWWGSVEKQGVALSHAGKRCNAHGQLHPGNWACQLATPVVEEKEFVGLPVVNSFYQQMEARTNQGRDRERERGLQTFRMEMDDDAMFRPYTSGRVYEARELDRRMMIGRFYSPGPASGMSEAERTARRREGKKKVPPPLRSGARAQVRLESERRHDSKTESFSQVPIGENGLLIVPQRKERPDILKTAAPANETEAPAVSRSRNRLREVRVMARGEALPGRYRRLHVPYNERPRGAGLWSMQTHAPGSVRTMSEDDDVDSEDFRHDDHDSDSEEEFYSLEEDCECEEHLPLLGDDDGGSEGFYSLGEDSDSEEDFYSLASDDDDREEFYSLEEDDGCEQHLPPLHNYYAGREDDDVPLSELRRRILARRRNDREEHLRLLDHYYAEAEEDDVPLLILRRRILARRRGREDGEYKEHLPLLPNNDAGPDDDDVPLWEVRRRLLARRRDDREEHLPLLGDDHAGAEDDDDVPLLELRRRILARRYAQEQNPGELSSARDQNVHEQPSALERVRSMLKDARQSLPPAETSLARTLTSPARMGGRTLTRAKSVS